MVSTGHLLAVNIFFTIADRILWRKKPKKFT
jgi:hypothetical protein